MDAWMASDRGRRNAVARRADANSVARASAADPAGQQATVQTKQAGRQRQPLRRIGQM